MIDEPNGLLPIVNFDSQTGWDDLANIAQPHLDTLGAERLKASLDTTASSVVLERHYIDRDYRDTFSQYHSKRFITPDSRCTRLHFFDKHMSRADIKHHERLQSHYLGYSIIRPTRPNCIGRTLLKPECRATTQGTISECNETVSMHGTELKISGFPFISQDADVTVCAQASLWMMARYFSKRYHLYPETYPVQIGNLTRDYSVGRLFPTAGLYVWQLAEALRRLGFSPLLYSRALYSQINKTSHPDNFEHLLYTYIESGIPVLAAFNNHVVVLFGHVSDYTALTSAHPESGCNFIYSSALNYAYVGNDDNGVPYQLISKGARQQRSLSYMSRPIDQIEQFVAPLPEKVFLPAENFETLVNAILVRNDFGYITLSPIIASATPILRLFLTTGRSYKRRLTERGMGNALVEEIYRNLPLPHFIWVCEISHQSIYPANILGEIIWDATRNAHEPDGWIALHYPEVLIVDRGSALNCPPELVSFELTGSTPYPIYRSNLRDIQ